MTTNSMSIGVPIKILHEAEGHIVTVETKSGEVFRGKLLEAEDDMNCQMANVEVTYRDGTSRFMEMVCLRGSKIRFIILPDMLKNAPMLKNIGTGLRSRGRSAAIRGQAFRGRARGAERGGRARGGTQKDIGSWRQGRGGGRGSY